MNERHFERVWPEWEYAGELGRGQFGQVYKAQKRKNGIISEAAIKEIEISASRAVDNYNLPSNVIPGFLDAQIENITREIRVMENLKSAANIVSIEDYDVVRSKNGMNATIVIRMELLESLKNYKRRKWLTTREVCLLGRDICRALLACSQYGIIHRDIKDDNIFVNEFGDFKLGDFGIAKQMENAAALGTAIGTPLYVAPEVLQKGVYDGRVDIYSLGIVLYCFISFDEWRKRPVCDGKSYSESDRTCNSAADGR